MSGATAGSSDVDDLSRFVCSDTGSFVGEEVRRVLSSIIDDRVARHQVVVATIINRMIEFIRCSIDGDRRRRDETWLQAVG